MGAPEPYSFSYSLLGSRGNWRVLVVSESLSFSLEHRSRARISVVSGYAGEVSTRSISKNASVAGRACRATSKTASGISGYLLSHEQREAVNFPEEILKQQKNRV